MGSTPEDAEVARSDAAPGVTTPHVVAPDAAKPGVTTPETAARVVVKKYANRRLYNTESSSYITLDTLSAMVRNGRDFAVFDAKTGEDITRSVLTQIIVEEESKGRAMLPTNFMRHVIGYYGDAMPPALPPFMEQAMGQFARQQQQIRTAMEKTIGGFLPPGIEEMSRQNMAMMERAMALFAPFYRDANAHAAPGAALGAAPGAARNAVAAPAALAKPEDAAPDHEMAALRDQVRRLQGELDALRQAAPRQAAPPETAKKAPAGRTPDSPQPATRSGKRAGKTVSGG